METAFLLFTSDDGKKLYARPSAIVSVSENGSFPDWSVLNISGEFYVVKENASKIAHALLQEDEEITRL